MTMQRLAPRQPARASRLGRHSRGRIEMSDMIQVSFPRVRRLLRLDPAAVLDDADYPSRHRVALGFSIGGIQVVTEVTIVVLGFESNRFPIPSCLLLFECIPVTASRYLNGAQAELAAFPVSRSVTGVRLEGQYQTAPELGSIAETLIVHRAVRACAADLFDGIVRRLERSGQDGHAGRDATEADLSRPTRAVPHEVSPLSQHRQPRHRAKGRRSRR